MINRSSLKFCLISIMAFMISLPIWASAEEGGTEFVAISGEKYSVVYTIKGRVCLKPNPKDPGKFSVRKVAPGEAIGKDEICLDEDTMSVILNNQLPTLPQQVTAEVIAAADALVASGIAGPLGACTLSTLPGVDMLSVANDLLSRGANLESVKESLSEVCYALPASFTYTPPVVPITPTSTSDTTTVQEASPSS
jgi:hypothetical protein